MFRKIVISGFILAFALPLIASAQDTTSTGQSAVKSTEILIGEKATLQISGFGDLLAIFQEENDGEMFNIGQVEVDLESELTDKFSMALAIAYDEGNFTIGAFTADYNIWSAGETTPLFLGIDDVTIGGGQFDVPFGIDYHVYPSIDRKLVSSPLVVESTHDSWTDYGGYATADASWGNITAFVVNGFCHEGTDPEAEDFETHNDLAIGGRLGLVPHEMIEIGGSAAQVNGLDGTNDMLLAGVDIQLSAGNFELKGEYIAHQFKSDVDPEFTNDGYYIQSLYNIGNLYLVGRYDEFRPNQKSEDKLRISSGIGYSVNEIVNLRLEYQIHESDYDIAVFQVAFGF